MSSAKIINQVQKTLNYPISNQQKSILKFVIEKENNLGVQALAGSGKSEVLTLIAKALMFYGAKPSDFRVLVFGKANAQDLNSKFTQMGLEWSKCASTLHSCGYGLIREHLESHVQIKSEKYSRIAKDLGYLNKYDYKTKKFRLGKIQAKKICSKKSFLTLLDLCRSGNNEVTPEYLDQLANYHVIETSNLPFLSTAINDCLNEGNHLAANQGIIDFTDMIYLPVFWELVPRHPYKYLLVDEAQDENNAQIQLVKNLSQGNKVICVGDRFQAIYGFTGAGTDSMDILKDTFDLSSKPLSTCYRCPKSHLELVKQTYPHIKIKSRKEAPEGIIQCILDSDSLSEYLRQNDLVICRKTSPLVKVCLSLVGQGIKAFVKGRDIGVAINAELDKVSKQKSFSFDRLEDFCNEYMLNIREQFQYRENKEDFINPHQDKVDCILAIYNYNRGFSSLDSLKTKISSIFQDSDDSPVTLCTVHKAKGLEADRVFILEYDQLPMRREKQRDWQFQQEQNLHYVALTRSRQDLYLVNS